MTVQLTALYETQKDLSVIDNGLRKDKQKFAAPLSTLSRTRYIIIRKATVYLNDTN